MGHTNAQGDSDREIGTSFETSFGTSLGLLFLSHILFFQLSITWIYHNYIKWQIDGSSHHRNLPLPAMSSPTSTPVHFMRQCLRNPRKLVDARIVVPSLFGVTFSCCLSLLSLLLFEPLGLLSWQARRCMWHADLVVLACLVYLILPMTFVSVFSFHSNDKNAGEVQK